MKEMREKAVIWVVGDSTLSSFEDQSYFPREGYGEELDQYLNADVYNLAVSGASSRDFTAMENYRILLTGNDKVPAMGSLKDREQFLLIGFGHNDEKTGDGRYTNPNGDYQTKGSFASSLYEQYIKRAGQVGVIPVVCTPIVRLTYENTEESYKGNAVHITETLTEGEETFPGGDYAESIRQLCRDTRTQCIDMTELTRKMNLCLGENAKWLHAFTGAKYKDDEGEKEAVMVPSGLDLTHTNRYGAKVHAWLIAEADTGLKKFSKHCAMPEYETEFEKAKNQEYRIYPYHPPLHSSRIWPEFKDTLGYVWKGSVFGALGGDEKISEEHFSAAIKNDRITLSVSDNTGKIDSAVDGFMMYYLQIPADAAFTWKAEAVIEEFSGDFQCSFGLMVRDNMYVDVSREDISGDYVAAGTLWNGKVNCFGRKDGALKLGPEAEIVYKAGDKILMTIISTQDGFTMKYGDNSPVSAGFDYPLTGIDREFIYLGLYVARNCRVTFHNISLVFHK